MKKEHSFYYCLFRCLSSNQLIVRKFSFYKSLVSCFMLVTLLVSCSLFTINAQSHETLFSQQVENIRLGGKQNPEALKSSAEKESKELLQTASKYSNDSVVEVRRLVYSTYRLILKSQARPSDIKKEVVVKLTAGIEDTDSYIRQLSTGILTECTIDDFSEQAKNIFCNIFNKREWFSKEFILLSGFVGSDECKETLEYLAYSPTQAHQRFNWAAYVALARMGDQNAINWCLSRINSITLNDDVTAMLLPDLVYTRQYRIYEYLVSVLNSDEELCLSTNPDYEKPIICGYRVMEYLAPVIRRYPLSLLPSGDIDTRDYNKALLSVREWFAKQNGKYEIITSTF